MAMGIVDPILRDELSHDLRRPDVFRDPDDLQMVRVLLLERDEVWNFSTTRRTPRSPEVDDCHLSTKVLTAQRTPIERAQSETRQGLRLLEELKDRLFGGCGLIHRRDAARDALAHHSEREQENPEHERSTHVHVCIASEGRPPQAEAIPVALLLERQG